MSDFLKRFAAHEGGATAIEYGLIVGVIAVVIVVGITSVGTSNGGQWANIANNYPR